MLTQRNTPYEHETTVPLPQADGDSRPFVGPECVHAGAVGPSFGPPAEHVIKARDAAITALVEPLARMLYQAFQIQHLGAFDHVPFEDLSNAAKHRLVNDARCALHLQSPLYRREMERQVKLTFEEGLETTVLHFPEMNPVADDRVRELQKQAIEYVTRSMGHVDMSTLFLVSQRMALTTPIEMSAQKQVTLTALRGGHDGF